MAKTFRLTNLSIDDVSSVDKGAGQGVRVVLAKRDTDPYTSIEKGDLSDQVVAYLKREFSADQRKEMADKGQAMPGGGFPIATEEDLHNAIRAVGRAKDPEAAKAHIKTRAKAMGLESALPEDWVSKSLFLKAMDFDEAKNRDAMDRAVWALQSVISSILCDDDETDKAAAIATSINQFKAYIAGLAPVSKTEKTMPMTAAETAALEKQIAESVAKAVAPLTAELAKRDEEIAILKQAPEHRELYKAMSAEEKKKFDAMTQEEKDEAAKETKKRAAVKIDPEIQKRLDQAEANDKVLKALVEKDQIATFAKRAKDLGLPEADGEIMRKAYGGDAAAQTELDKRIKALTAQVNVGKVFDEFGHGGPGNGDKPAYEQLKDKAAELRKTADGAKLTPEQAFTKVYEDPANKDLVAKHKSEEIQKRQRAA